MKKANWTDIILISVLFVLFSYSALFAEPVPLEQAHKAAFTFLSMRNVPLQEGPRALSVPGQDTRLSSVEARGPAITAKGQTAGRGLTLAGFREIRSDDGAVLAYIAELSPRGFVATSADTDIRPIVAYSFKNSFPPDEDRKNPLYRLLKEDMKLRAKALAEYDQFKTMENNNLWNSYARQDTRQSARVPTEQGPGDTFQQWPQENTTSTGGWLETAWHQELWAVWRRRWHRWSIIISNVM